MKTLLQKSWLCWVCIYLGSSIWCLAQFSNRINSPNDTLQSIKIGPDHSVTLSIYAPKASEVKVSGDFLQGAPSPTLAKGENGVWTYTSTPVKPDVYTYEFYVDGVKTFDTKSSTFKENPNALFNFFEMNGPETEFLALKNVPHGKVEKVLYHSNSLQTERRMHVYLPPNYDKIKGKLPVLYLLHGGGDNDISWTSAGKANLILDNLYAEGKLKDMIVVMPSGHTPVKGFAMGIGPDQDPFCKDFLNDLMPYVEKNFPVSTKREDRAIAGLSMGGIQTLNIALWHPDLFSYVYPMSTGYFSTSIKELEEKYGGVLKNPSINQFKIFIIGMGKDDGLAYKNNKGMMETFDKYGMKYVYRETPGYHSYPVWRENLAFIAPQLFR